MCTGLDKLAFFVDCLVNIMASDTRNRILSVAARLFEAHGFDGTAVAAILSEADVNSGSLYHFFPGKEALLVAVLEKYLDTLEPALLEAANRATDDPLDTIFALLELYRGRLLVSGFSRGCPVGDLALEIGSRHPEVRALVDAYFGAWTARVCGWLESAGDRLPPHTDRRALAAHVLAVMQGGVMQARTAGSIQPFDDSVSQLRLLLDLLGAGVESPADTRSRRRRVSAAGTSIQFDDSAPIPSETDPVIGTPLERSAGKREVVGADEAAWWRAW